MKTLMQPFVLYNSEQRKKVEFVPRKEGHIDMYVCGMTVYDYCHIGHARVMVAFTPISPAAFTPPGRGA
ncbi:hypothetical protein ACTXQV_59245, partial [Klebsiella pneumoniae]